VHFTAITSRDVNGVEIGDPKPLSVKIVLDKEIGGSPAQLEYQGRESVSK